MDDLKLAQEWRAEVRRAVEAERAPLLALLKSIAPEMRREHDAGDGHFSTEQVESVEAAIRRRADNECDQPK